MKTYLFFHLQFDIEMLLGVDSGIVVGRAVRDFKQTEQELDTKDTANSFINCLNINIALNHFVNV